MNTSTKNVKKDVVFISGGMSGLGSELGRRYVCQGASLAIFDLQENTQTLSGLQACITSSDQLIKVYSVDICDPIAMDSAVNIAVNEIGTPTIALNSAGILRTGTFSEISFETFKQVIDVNLIGSRNFAASVVPHLQKGGHLALVASIAGIIGTYTHAAYAASKFGVVGLAQVLRVELKQQGIDVSVICPGEIDTPMLKQERVDGSEVAKTLNAFSGVLSVEQACKGIFNGLQKRQFMITPGIRAKFTREFAHKASTVFRKLVDIKLSRALR